ncbi:hypothetical protein PZH32_03095 [Adlercreutzia equolifaciens]|uniref:hypothetical protein n=1 Tax=Adlercreutzia equolifaciens TaxID=446660 RepID=UPI0023B1828C|nr:hypothetical protein [Adlercreutzia equolifaciens]MDE8701943.1 hypothetical protein [Adlercreutzia equolifaciens]
MIIRETGLQIVAASGWTANKKATTSLTASVTSSTLNLGYRSRGKVAIKGVAEQLSCDPIKLRALKSQLRYNENGFTLGTYDDALDQNYPDLIGIIADSGVEGFAFYSQFIAEIESERIPVYSEDGITEIGFFTFGNK